MSDVTICIPSYEMNGKGHVYLEYLLDSIAYQEGVDFDVIVSDQSTDDKIVELCKKYDFVECLQFDGPRNACHNTNNAMKHAKGKVVKIMFADDWFVSPSALKNCTQPILEGAKWLASGCTHSDGIKRDEIDGRCYYVGLMKPRYHSEIHYGKNTISSPSVISVINDDIPEFDENVCLLLDVDWYKRLELKYGPPHITETFNICNRVHSDSLQGIMGDDLQNVLEEEKKYISKKYEGILNG